MSKTILQQVYADLWTLQHNRGWAFRLTVLRDAFAHVRRAVRA